MTRRQRFLAWRGWPLVFAASIVLNLGVAAAGRATFLTVACAATLAYCLRDWYAQRATAAAWDEGFAQGAHAALDLTLEVLADRGVDEDGQREFMLAARSAAFDRAYLQDSSC